MNVTLPVGPEAAQTFRAHTLAIVTVPVTRPPASAALSEELMGYDR
jgi:hypothetical protein